MSQFVPCTPNGVARWTQRTALDGVDYLLTFRWSQREGHWLLDVATAEASPIVSGLALVVGSLLLVGVVDARRPAGQLVAVDTTGANDADPAFDDLGTRFVLTYVTAAELAA